MPARRASYCSADLLKVGFWPNPDFPRYHTPLLHQKVIPALRRGRILMKPSHLGDVSRALDTSGMEDNFCAAVHATNSAQGNRRPRTGEIPIVRSSPLVKVAALTSRQKSTAERAKCPFFEAFTFAALGSLRPIT